MGTQPIKDSEYLLLLDFDGPQLSDPPGLLERLGGLREVYFSVKEDVFNTGSFSNVVTRIFWEVVYFILLPVELVRWAVIRFAILPAIYLESKNKVKNSIARDEAWERIRNNHVEGQEFKRVSIRTADGVRLETLEIRHPNQISKTPVEQKWIIFFNGNACSTEGMIEVLSKLSKDTGANVYSGDYRGVGLSEGFPWRSQDLVIDGEAMVQYLFSKGVKEKNILIHGWSIGGGVGTAVAAKHPDINFCNDRSFAKLSLVARESIGRFLGDAVGFIAAAIVRFIGWELDSVNNYDKINGDKFIMYHPCDGCIHRDVSLYRGVKNLHMDPQDREKKILRAEKKAQGLHYEREYPEDYKPLWRIRLIRNSETWMNSEGPERIYKKKREMEDNGKAHHCSFNALSSDYINGYNDYLARVRSALRM